MSNGGISFFRLDSGGSILKMLFEKHKHVIETSQTKNMLSLLHTNK